MMHQWCDINFWNLFCCCCCMSQSERSWMKYWRAVHQIHRIWRILRNFFEIIWRILLASFHTEARHFACLETMLNDSLRSFIVEIISINLSPNFIVWWWKFNSNNFFDSRVTCTQKSFNLIHFSRVARVPRE